MGLRSVTNSLKLIIMHSPSVWALYYTRKALFHHIAPKGTQMQEGDSHSKIANVFRVHLSSLETGDFTVHMQFKESF